MRYKCRVCHGVHLLKRCDKFRRMRVEDRMRALILHQYCDNCLAHDHYHRGCTSRERCLYCKERQHSLLHVHQSVQKQLGHNAQTSTPVRSHSRPQHKRSKPTHGKVAVTSSRPEARSGQGLKRLSQHLHRSAEHTQSTCRLWHSFLFWAPMWITKFAL